MSAQTNLEMVQAIFDGYTKHRSLTPLLEAITEDVIYEVTIEKDTPLGGQFVGREGLIKYFTNVSALVQQLELTVKGFVAAGDKVVALGFERSLVKKTGKIFESECAVIHTFRGDKIEKIEVIEDCTAIAEACRL